MKKFTLHQKLPMGMMGFLLFSQVMGQSSLNKQIVETTQLGAYNGYSVAMSGNFAVSGAYMEDGNSLNSGAAYVYINQGGNKWKEFQRLSPERGYSEACFGTAVDISENKIIVGAQVDDEKMNNAGAAYIFEKENGGNWKQTAKIFAEDPGTYEFFGFSAAIDGNLAFVGAIQDGSGSSSAMLKGTGAVYVFRKENTEWKQIQKLVAVDGRDEDYFGYSIAVSGNQLFIGSFAQDLDENGGSPVHLAGAVYVFERSETGHYNFKQKLVASDRKTESYFGSSLDIDGNYAVIGAHQMNENGMKASGAVYMFKKNAKGVWEETQKISDPTADKFERFGFSVSISGNDMIAGSCYKIDLKNERLQNRGSVLTYHLNDEGKWVLKEKLQSPETRYDNWFGYSVAMDKGKFIVGAHKNGEGDKERSGAVYFKGDCKLSYSEMNITSCTPYEFMGNTYDKSGTYRVTLTNIGGCDSIISLTLTIQEVNTNVISDNGKLVSTAEKASFQWIKSENNESISKANKKYFTPVTDGNYAVIVTQNGCKDTSASFTYVKMNLETTNLADDVKVFPNPVSDILNIQLTADYEKISVSMFDLAGKMVYQQDLANPKYFTIDVSTFPVGAYMLNLTAGEKSTTVKVVRN